MGLVITPKPPKLTRSQERYRRFLDSGFGGTFGEYLKYGRKRTEERTEEIPF